MPTAVELQFGFSFDRTAYPLHEPARTRAMLLGTVHQVTLAADVSQEADGEQLEVSTACGLTDTTDIWRWGRGEAVIASEPWRERERLGDGLHHLCPRCFPKPAADAEVARA